MSPSPTPSEVPATADVRAERHLRHLAELAELGMKLARAVTEQAVADAASDAPTNDPGLVFSRIARAVRMTIALEAKLAEDLETRTQAAQAKAAERAAEAARAPIVARKATVRRAVSRAIRLDVHDDEDEDLLDALEDHLGDRSSDARFLDRPILEVVTRICNDLGVTANPSLWQDDDWAREDASRAQVEPVTEHAGDPSLAPRAAPPDEPPLRPPSPTH